MNMFPLGDNACPRQSAKDNCDKHVIKIITEITQMATSAAIRHNATTDMLPLTKAGNPHRGGYHNHPMTRWIGDSRENYLWAIEHGSALCVEYTNRYGKTHFCTDSICNTLLGLAYLIPSFGMTTMPQCMPEEYKVEGDVVTAYRNYYMAEKRYMATWKECRGKPSWWHERDFLYGVKFQGV